MPPGRFLHELPHWFQKKKKAGGGVGENPGAIQCSPCFKGGDPLFFIILGEAIKIVGPTLEG